MASISNAISGNVAIYPESSTISSDDISKYKNIVLLVIDGMWYNYLQKNGGDLTQKWDIEKLQTVFPSATSVVLNTFATGLPAQQHAITGWYMLFKELWIVGKTLPFASRIDEKSFAEQGIDPNFYFEKENIVDFSHRDCYHLNRDYLIDTEFTKTTNKKSKRFWYSDFQDLCDNIVDIIYKNEEKKYIYAYDPDLDTLWHQYGIESSEAKDYLELILKKIKKLAKDLKSKNTLLLVTADHGQIDTTIGRTMFLDHYPKLKNMLSLPFCGETRTVFCYVKADKKEEFRNLIKTDFNNVCEIYDSLELLEKWFFWLYEPNNKIYDRIWDFTLIMKENYIFLDSVLNQKKEKIIWNHGWIHPDEVYVPLITFKS